MDSSLATKHQPCDLEQEDGSVGCGSSDAMMINPDGSRKCFSCNQWGKSNTIKPVIRKEPSKPMKSKALTALPEPTAIADRCLSQNAAKRWGIAQHRNFTFFPYYDKEGKHVANKVRGIDKGMHSEGEIKQAAMFGQHLFPPGCAKTITIVEGEYDAVSSWVMQGSQYPVVSIKNGASGALRDCKDNYDYLDSFKEIVVNFDNDEPGQKAAEEVLQLFSGKAKNLKLQRHKDASDYLVNGQGEAYTSEWWKAEKYVPSGIVAGSALKAEVMQPFTMPLFSFPWDGLNLLCYGVRGSEIITITAGTGAGKSTTVKQIVDECLQTTNHSVGILSLEEDVKTAALSMMSLKANKLLHLPTKEQMRKILKNPDNIKLKPDLPDKITDEEKEKLFHDTFDSDRIWFYKHRGDTTVESVCNRIKYMAKVLECPIIVLDHISILVGMQHSAHKGDERQAIDDTMHMLRSIVEETGCTIINVSHLSKPQGSDTSHEEGGRVKMSQLRGSNAIAQLSNVAIALERNGQAEDEEDRNLTTVRVLKNRFSGETGIATHLKWDASTGRLVEVINGPDIGEVI